MSAKKCGQKFAVLIIEDDADYAPSDTVCLPTLVCSRRAYSMFNRIRRKYPNFFTIHEAEIWKKARRMGLMEEE
jgi:hypothetical protein